MHTREREHSKYSEYFTPVMRLRQGPSVFRRVLVIEEQPSHLASMVSGVMLVLLGSANPSPVRRRHDLRVMVVTCAA